MSAKYRILSFHYIPNNGAFLFAFSLLGLFKKEFLDNDVKIIDYKSTRLALYEYLKRYKVFQSIPLFYLKRARMWREVVNEHLDLDVDFPHFSGEGKIQKYFAEHYDAIIVGMDTWCILDGTERPRFPNLYWLPERMDVPKIAYGVSAYNSDLSLIRQHAGEIRSYLNEFDVIGARDRFTHEIVMEHRTRSDGLVQRVPDPTFLYEIQRTNVVEKLASMGVDLDRPILGLLLFGDSELSRRIQTHYRAKGYQILALSMYNSFADINTGHVLNPFEWAQAFGLLTFCITDRFHGTIFCIKNQVPFISLEKDRRLPLSQSKLYDLLTDFDLTTCYRNPVGATFDISEFLSYADEIEGAWDRSFRPNIASKIQQVQKRHREFIRRMKVELAR